MIFTTVRGNIYSHVVNYGNISSRPNCYFSFIISYFLFKFTSGRLITCLHNHEAVSAVSSLHLNVSREHLFVQHVAPVGDDRCNISSLNRTDRSKAGVRKEPGL